MNMIYDPNYEEMEAAPTENTLEECMNDISLEDDPYFSAFDETVDGGDFDA